MPSARLDWIIAATPELVVGDETHLGGVRGHVDRLPEQSPRWPDAPASPSDSTTGMPS